MEEEHANAVAEYGDLLDDEVEADYHRFVVPDGCHWDDLRRLTDNVGIGLQRILDRLQQANPITLAQIFGDVAWGNKDKLPETALLNLIDAFNSLDLAPARRCRRRGDHRLRRRRRPGPADYLGGGTGRGRRRPAGDPR